MKAVLCLWAREHLKGRPGPGSGLARLLKKKQKKNTTLSSVYVRVCLCVWQRAAKQDGCARLLLAETLRGTDSCRCCGEQRDERMVSPALKAAHLLLPVVLLQVRLAGGATPPQRSLEER